MVVIIFFGEKHGSSVLMKGVPKLGPLFYELTIRGVIVFIVKFQRFHKVPMNQFRFLIDVLYDIIHAAFNIN
jgi:hypothetical protein